MRLGVGSGPTCNLLPRTGFEQRVKAERPAGVRGRAVITGEVTKDELDIRASQGAFTMVAPGVNERAVEAAGLRLLDITDTTAEMGAIACRWIDARDQRRPILEVSEGVLFFERRRLFLETVARLASNGHFSRFVYLAEKA